MGACFPKHCRMMNRFACTTLRALAIVVPLLALATSARAHPGHGLLDHGTRHALTSPYHAGVLAAIGVGCWLAGRFATRRVVPRRVLTWAGATALLAAVALWTFGV